MKSRIFLTSYNLLTFLIVSLFLQNFECSKWENHVFMEFLLSFFQCCFMSETQVLMTVFNFSWFFSRNHFLEGGFTFQCRGGGDFRLGGFIFKWGERPAGSSVLMGGVSKKKIPTWTWNPATLDTYAVCEIIAFDKKYFTIFYFLSKIEGMQDFRFYPHVWSLLENTIIIYQPRNQ